MTTEFDIETWRECARYWRWFITAATPRQVALEVEKALIAAKRGDFDLAFGLLMNIPPRTAAGAGCRGVARMLGRGARRPAAGLS